MRAKLFLMLMLFNAMSFDTMSVTGRCWPPHVAGKKARFSVRSPSDSLRTEKSAKRRFIAAARLRRVGGVGRFWQTCEKGNYERMNRVETGTETGSGAVYLLKYLRYGLMVGSDDCAIVVL